MPMSRWNPSTHHLLELTRVDGTIRPGPYRYFSNHDDKVVTLGPREVEFGTAKQSGAGPLCRVRDVGMTLENQKTWKLPRPSGGFPEASGSFPEASGKLPETSGSFLEASASFPEASGSFPESSGSFPGASG
jgi:hypothetical protein